MPTMTRLLTNFIAAASLLPVITLPAQALVAPARAASAPPATAAPAAPKAAPPAALKVDINSASEQELMKTLEVDAADAKLIIKKRRYESAQDLVTRKVLSFKKFKAIKDRVTVGAAKP
jgi:DNA uptake protein ComE-like DNA-binding protein